MFTVQFARRYAMAHRLLADRESKCATPHGHNETVRVSLASESRPDFGGANHSASFESLKRRWHGWIDGAVDHALQLNRADPLVGWFAEHEPERVGRLMLFDGDPTTEALTVAFHRKLSAFLRAEALPFTCIEVAVEETPTNTVILDAKGALAAAGWSPGAWCERADMSLNDLDASGAARPRLRAAT